MRVGSNMEIKYATDCQLIFFRLYLNRNTVMTYVPYVTVGNPWRPVPPRASSHSPLFALQSWTRASNDAGIECSNLTAQTHRRLSQSEFSMTDFFICNPEYKYLFLHYWVL